MSNEYDVYPVSTVWIPDESRQVIRINTSVDTSNCAIIQFDDEYELYIKKPAIINMISLLNETLTALSTKPSRKNNILKFMMSTDEKDTD